MITFYQLLENLRKPREISKFIRDNKSLSQVDNREVGWRGNLPDLFKRYGFAPVGAGKYGYVFSHPKYPYIVKVFIRDTAYLKWLNFAKQNSSNPYVPKIRGKVIKLGPTLMAVRLEKLTEGGNPDHLYDADERGDRYATQVVDFLEANNKLIDLHAGNVMLRGKQLVIIDPLYNWRRNDQFTISPDDISQFQAIIREDMSDNDAGNQILS